MLTRTVQPRRQIIMAAHMPAPLGGINRADPASAMPPLDCLSLKNMLGSQYGLKVRYGYREWCTGLGSPAEEVRSILSFAGSTDDGLADRLFACTTSGIWDVTESSAAPVQVYAFPTSNGTSGYGVGTSFVTSAGHFYLYCDEANGYLVYDESTDTWELIAEGSDVGEIQGVDPRHLAFVMVWKSRVWFVERDTANAWYLDAGAMYGTVTRFTFGNKFRYGGSLVGLWNWTIDGGAGIDDLLVAVSRAGDVAIYQGTDPDELTTFSQRGMWFVGGVPAGRRVCTDFGGDILLLSSLGVIPLSKLISGGEIASPDAFATRKIAPYFQDAMSVKKGMSGWEVRIHPEDSSLIIETPTFTAQPAKQFVMSLSSKGWSEYEGLPMKCAESWRGKLYFGTEDGRICINDGLYDNVAIDGSVTEAYDVAFSGLSAFQSLGNVNKKRMQFFRVLLRVNGATPSCIEEARYDFDEREISTALPAAPVSGSALWGTAIWGTSLWTGGLKPSIHVRGATGIGTHMAVAWKGTAHSQVILIGFDLSWDEGGRL